MSEVADKISPEQIKGFSERIGPALELFRKACEAIILPARRFLFYLAWLRGSTPAERYKLAGHPYGKHTRGKKRWLLEMKRKAKRA